ncbi:alpha/beta fold hydrolase [Clostridium oryzae]|uniref:Haloalkane dehalogenase n=1 Tax=Clostridium oryzae TaxID=1450648 RepID=A0A1V4IQ02_9CLOT|nr:alpha/beta hydrolase [Clostridium oryzae]OPJ61547.1 haloalkane dehalogenase [Clostridium oryzae]
MSKGDKMKFASASNSVHKYGKMKPKYSKKIEKKKRIWEIIFYLIIVLLCAGLIYQSASTNMELNKYKMDGELVSVGNHRLLVNTTGYGDYSAVLIGDTGSYIGQWDKVKNGLSQKMKVFTYDRSGFGWSDSPQTYPNISKSVDMLRVALYRSGVPRQYILVAHGYGAILAEKYAEKYPDEVVGIVAIDSIMENDIQSPEFQKQISSKIQKYKISKIASYFGLVRLGYKSKLIYRSKGYVTKLSQEDRALYNCQRATSKYFKASISEMNNIKNYNESLQKKNALKKKYFTVVTPGRKYKDASKNSAYIEQQKKLLSMSKESQQIVVRDSGSYVQVFDPNVVVDAVNSILQEVNR